MSLNFIFKASYFSVSSSSRRIFSFFLLKYKKHNNNCIALWRKNSKIWVQKIGLKTFRAVDTYFVYETSIGGEYRRSEQSAILTQEQACI
jgi:hypothetical protein